MLFRGRRVRSYDWYRKASRFVTVFSVTLSCLGASLPTYEIALYLSSYLERVGVPPTISIPALCVCFFSTFFIILLKLFSDIAWEIAWRFIK